MIATIIGGNGFIGRNLALGLIEAGHSVRVLDAAPARYGPASDAITEYRGDAAAGDALDEAVAGAEVVYHLAWSSLPEPSNLDPQGDVRANLIQVLRVIDACVTHRVRKLVFLSSGGTVYGIPTQTPIPEDHPTDPVCSYGITKLAAEKYVALAHRLHGLDAAAVRLSNPYGELQNPAGAQGAVAAFLGRIARREPITVWGDGSTVRDYLYIGDAVRALVQLGEFSTSDTASRVVNVGSGVGVSISDLLAAIRRVVGLPFEVRHTPGRLVDVPVNVLDVSRIRRTLGWSPSVSLDDGILRTWRWVQAQHR